MSRQTSMISAARVMAPHSASCEESTIIRRCLTEWYTAPPLRVTSIPTTESSVASAVTSVPSITSASVAGRTLP